MRPSTALIIVVLLGSTALVYGGLPGGYSRTDVTDELESLLFTSLQASQLYADTVDARVCATHIRAIDQQVVAGMNYRFHVDGCDVIKTLQQQNKRLTAHAINKELGKCRTGMANDCDKQEMIITIFEQPWTDTIEISSIEFVQKD